MMILLNNISWMGWNVILALIPPIFGWLLFITRQKVLKVVFALIWFLFLPNTLYLITDLPHIIWQWHRIHHAGQIVLALQYITLVLVGLVTFLLALYPVEKELLRSSWLKKKSLVPLFIVMINFFIGLITFLLALYPVEKALLRSSWLKKKSLVSLFIIMTNFLLGLGIVLGRVQRINSWDVIVDIPKVIVASLSIFNSLELILFVLFFGIFANVYYFVWRKSFQMS